MQSSSADNVIHFDNAVLLLPAGGDAGSEISAEEVAAYFVLKNSNEAQGEEKRKIDTTLPNAPKASRHVVHYYILSSSCTIPSKATMHKEDNIHLLNK